MFNFYYIGSLIIGGGHVIIPLMLTIFSSRFGLSEDSFWNGFSFASAMPGPLFNFSIYVGSLIDGPLGAGLSGLSLFAPAFFSIWGLLPYWDKYRNRPKVKRIL